MTRARVIGLGQRAAGDDGVGLAVIDRLRGLAMHDVELVQIAEPSALITMLLESSTPIVVVDAVMTERGVSGEIVEIDANSLPPDVGVLSTHGVGLAQALALARALAAPRDIPPVRIVGVTITRAEVPSTVLSAAVESALPRAVEAVLSVVRALRSEIDARRP